jgi:hypothetical protein
MVEADSHDAVRQELSVEESEVRRVGVKSRDPNAKPERATPSRPVLGIFMTDN